MNFNELGLSSALVEKLTAQGVTEPSAVQRGVMAPLRAGRDCLIQARTGSGKTLAFLLPLLEARPGTVLIVAPTRELALQISGVLETFVAEADTALLCGGRDWAAQRDRLEQGAIWLIGTPGRLLAHLRQGNIAAERCQCLVLDEADQLLEIGFREEVGEIVRALSARRQTVLVSATLPPAVLELADVGLNDPFCWRENESAQADAAIEESFIALGKQDKANVLCRLINQHCIGQGIVFCRTHWRAERLQQLLQQRGYPTALLHGKLTQTQREAAMEDFRSGMVQLLVATEVASRGLDIENVSHVFNYDIPREVDAYIHRIGRTGRAGRSGVAYTLVGAGDEIYAKKLRQALKQ